MQVRSMLLISLFAALMAVSSLMSVPLAGGVPFTLQVIVVMLAGFCLGPVYGAVSILVWVLLGVLICTLNQHCFSKIKEANNKIAVQNKQNKLGSKRGNCQIGSAKEQRSF